MSKQLITDPIPDEHVELGEEMTGGWYFAAEDPPKAVGMCHECVIWCQTNFDVGGQQAWAAYQETQR